MAVLHRCPRSTIANQVNTATWVEALEQRVAARMRRIPRRARIVLTVTAVAGAAFAATVLPFVAADHTRSVVEIAGKIPTTARVNTPVSFHVAADNTGGGNVKPLCIQVTADRPGVTRLAAVFQGLDHVAAIGDRVCGGAMSGSETVSIELQFTPTSPGPLHLRVVATEGAVEIGPARTYDMLVTSTP